MCLKQHTYKIKLCIPIDFFENEQILKKYSNIKFYQNNKKFQR